MTRRKLLQVLGIGAAAGVAGKQIVSGIAKSHAMPAQPAQPTQPTVFKPGSREQLVMDQFEKDPLKALALARTFLKVDPTWSKERTFVQLAIGPFGQYVAKSPQSDWDKCDTLYFKTFSEYAWIDGRWVLRSSI